MLVLLDCCVFYAESRESSRSSAAPRTETAVSRHAMIAVQSIPSAPMSQSTAASDATWSGSSSAAAVASAKRQSMTSSRREELLQQLKAVEDAIAKKRSKMH